MTTYTGSFAPWAPHLADSLGVQVDHVGMNGWTAAQMLNGIDGTCNLDVCDVSHLGLRQLLKDGSYTHVLLMAGANDLKGRLPSEIAADLKRLHEVCHAAGARTLALAIPHSKASTRRPTGFGERRRQVHQHLIAMAAGSSGWTDFAAPGEAEQPWEEGSMDFEVDGLHLTRVGYEHFAALLVRSPVFQSFLRYHPVWALDIPEVLEAEQAWRRRMRRWLQQYKDAVDATQDRVFDVQMAKASREELEALHKVLHEKGIQGLRAAVKALELQKLHKILMDEGIPGLRAAIKATKKAQLAAAKARHRGLSTAADVAKLAQIAFVPAAGAPLQEAAQRLRDDPATLFARLSSWRWSDADREPFGDIEDKDGIECFVDGVFTVCTVDNATYQPLPLRPSAEMSSEDAGSSSSSGGGSSSVGSVGSSSKGTGSEVEACSEIQACSVQDADDDGADMHPVALPYRELSVPWLSLPSARLSRGAIVHRGPLSGGHLKLYLQAEDGGRLYQVDVMKEASKLNGFNWGIAEPLKCASFAYPRSGIMYPTIFRFVPLADATSVEIPPAAASASELRVSERGNVLAGSGWFALRQGLCVSTALSAFVRLASRRWCHVELYNCRSFVREMAERLASDETTVTQAFDDVFRFVVLEREAHGDRARG